MPTPDPRLVHVTTATRAGGPGPNQDRVFVADNAVIVLDGASQPEPSEHDGGWLADTLGRELQRRLKAEPAEGLRQVLYDGIAAVAARHGLVRGQSPTTTVSIVRWNAQQVETLVLCDSPIVIFDRHGGVHVIDDDRIAETAPPFASPTSGFAVSDVSKWKAVVAAELGRRNSPGGFWIAEANPDAAHHARNATWPIQEVTAILAVTDGVSKGIDIYGTPPDWHAAFRLAKADPGLLIDAVHQAEISDPDGTHWPRSKRHDDKTGAFMQLQ